MGWVVALANLKQMATHLREVLKTECPQYLTIEGVIPHHREWILEVWLQCRVISQNQGRTECHLLL